MVFTLFTDGSFLRGGGRAGWAYLIVHPDNHEEEGYGNDNSMTSQNVAEMRALIQGLGKIPEGETIEVNCDSRYVIQGATTWTKLWKKNGWVTSAGTPVQNKFLWETIDALCQTRKVRFYWVKGHAGNVRNLRVDYLAKLAAGYLSPSKRKKKKMKNPNPNEQMKTEICEKNDDVAVS